MNGMQKDANFFRQKVNSFLGILLIGSACFWTVIYYFNNNAKAMDGGHNAEISQLLSN